MHRITILLTGLFLLFAFAFPAKSADPQGKKKKIVIKDDKVIVPDIEIDLKALEKSMQDMELHLNEHELNLENLDEELRVLDNLRIDIPEIDNIQVEIPDMEELAYSLKELENLKELEAFNTESFVIPPIPPIEIHIPEMNFDFRYDFGDAIGASQLFGELSEDEEIRLQALRAIAREDADTAIPALEKTLLHDSSPALRYQSVRYLARFVDDERTAPLLGEVIKNDKNVKVRKKAIRVLGKSKDPRAVEILEDIIK